ncbi:MAG: phosphatidylinositol mannoside acyltransferase [Actinobacteria bacterium]|nr:phosphatidylinositol mannoside acyltransferase [Actinomycetota bacterium]MCB9412421.1 phosphatidylinositol mannoside acyltransferase [Actinomycetota bacterium]
MQTPSEFLAYAGYTAGWRTVRFMPRRLAYATFSQLADQAWLQRGKGVRQLERNYARIVPDATSRQLRMMSREGMQKYFRYWCDVFRLPDQSPEKILQTVRWENKHLMLEGIAANKGVVAAVSHSGNWDHIGAYMGVAHGGVISVAEDLKPERLTEKFLDFRRGLGMDILTLRRGEDVYGRLVDMAPRREVYALLGDRDLTRRGVPVEFFGETTRMPAGPAALAYDTGAELFVANLWADDRFAYARVMEPIPVDRTIGRKTAIKQLTQAIADDLAAGIAAHPTDWHMLQPLWLSDLDQSRVRASDYDDLSADD